MMATFHPMGVGIMSKLKNYTIGKGIVPSVTPDKRFAENAEIIQMLKSIGVDFAQGYGVAMPQRVLKAVNA